MRNMLINIKDLKPQHWELHTPMETNNLEFYNLDWLFTRTSLIVKPSDKGLYYYNLKRIPGFNLSSLTESCYVTRNIYKSDLEFLIRILTRKESYLLHSLDRKPKLLNLLILKKIKDLLKEIRLN